MFERVLVVDDQADWLEAAVELLRAEGYEVRGATTFHEAQALLETFNPDLLITDVRLGEYNGLSLLLRARERRRQLACFVISAYDDPVLAREARQHGAIDFLLKPVDCRDLLTKIAQSVDSWRERRWPRMQVPVGIVAQVEGRTARLVDVSYGGARLELPFSADVGLPLKISIASVGVTANAVWVHADPSGASHQCGVALHLDETTTRQWRHLVDRFGGAAS